MSKCLLLTVILFFIVIRNNCLETTTKEWSLVGPWIRDPKPGRTVWPNKSKWYREYKFFWGVRQCGWLPLPGSAKGLTWDQCKRQCDLHWNCTAFNWAYQDSCETMNCGEFPPYPRGVLKGKNGWWKGFSKYELKHSGRYYGPYAKIWSNTQCEVLYTYYDKNRVQCEKICDGSYWLNGFNFRTVGRRQCDMMHCYILHPGIPVAPSQSKKDWESYSKQDITRTECIDRNEHCKAWADRGECNNPKYKKFMEKLCAKVCGLCEKAPGWKCPSFYCNGHKDWRHDFRCGKDHLSRGSPGQCNPFGEFPCCSDKGWCGNTGDHCSCTDCVDYRGDRAP